MLIKFMCRLFKCSCNYTHETPHIFITINKTIEFIPVLYEYVGIVFFTEIIDSIVVTYVAKETSFIILASHKDDYKI